MLGSIKNAAIFWNCSIYNVLGEMVVLLGECLQDVVFGDDMEISTLIPA